MSNACIRKAASGFLFGEKPDISKRKAIVTLRLRCLRSRFRQPVRQCH